MHAAEKVRPAQILLVDDDEVMLAFLSAVLSHEGYAIVTAVDGQTAWEAIREETPTLVVCDYMLPDFDGGVLLQKLRSHSRFRQLPFVMLTGNADPVQMLHNLDRGADDYLIKPVSPEELVKRIHAVLHKQSMGPSLQGHLRNLSLPDLFQLLNQNRRSGYLTVSQGTEQYVFSFEQGELFSAESESRTSRGQKAVFRALTSDEGEFSFHSQEHLPTSSEPGQGEGAEVSGKNIPRQELSSVGFLCLEGLRVRDELPQLMASLPHPNGLYQRRHTGPGAKEQQPTQEKEPSHATKAALLAVFDELTQPVSLSTILDKLPNTVDIELIKALLQLLELGQIEMILPTEFSLELPAFLEHQEGGFSIARHSSIPSYPSFVRGLFLGDTDKALAALNEAMEEGMTAEMAYHRIVGAAVVDLLHFDEQSPGQIPPNPLRKEVLQAVLERLWQRFSGRPPLQATIVLSWPQAPSEARQEHIAWLRAAGFGVFELAVDVQPSRIFEAVVHSGSSLLCMMVETAEAAQRLQAIQRFFGRWKYNNMELLVGGAFFKGEPGAVPMADDGHYATDLFDLLRKSYHLLKIPILGD